MYINSVTVKLLLTIKYKPLPPEVKTQDLIQIMLIAKLTDKIPDNP